MPDCFEILNKDLAGRIGRLRTPHGVVETPALMPVVNPHLRLIEPADLKRMGAEILITNSYIINQDLELKEMAERRGVHELLGFHGPIMTDSGAFQLSVYGDIEVASSEILEFQRSIGSDVCVPLDIPTPPDVLRARAEAELSETERRLSEARDLWEDGGALLAGPIQGSNHLDLRFRAARRIKEIGFDVCPVGAVVPLMEAYRFGELVDVVAASKKGLGPAFPVHLFGAGHPMMFALAAALGCDLFDSAAYALYARQGRYLSTNGTHHLEDLKYLPCCCEICRNRAPEDLANDPHKIELLARHNLFVSLAEIRQVRQSIWEGSLWELVERRCRSHPQMMDGLRALGSHADWIEGLDPASRSTCFYLGPESAKRPEVLRYGSRIDRIELSGRVLVADPGLVEEIEEFDHVLWFLPPFGPYPKELAETAPLNAEVPTAADDAGIAQATANLMRVMEKNPNATFDLRLKDASKYGFQLKEVRSG
ncbi:MAG: tRNA guanosine(15) transglycosylase TgtA [Methanothrix sp.]|jgi:7-cyano-7-deazaguanine tRNA-ribosyltransferase|uniref:tRNA-guanine(15) transglycosylase n=1 Tax=Methanothrix harundinacea TaxID=301375 RepID=A0A101FT22_9EURY|nr:MAG: tRNA-guanine(15) transglycosylase [Methanothrix harundinacea]KUK96127.1 MAG: tRNA-guanine(15) transglycosylase [Methanothrix harundinacea]MCP1392013.1 tRNA guanosine(15) transglycosylase TgtA [Methanothrix harundinacea]MDD5767335.1 tRNA guanosine(15) transglycosylase TgtA [Methanothrix sp.]MDI9399946.1 tRNA guanosine(15) transglycosylase TgtA [Euryarchaeota archaeon]